MAAAASSSPAVPLTEEEMEAQWSDQQRAWAEQQRSMRARLITSDALGFSWPPSASPSNADVPLTRVGGVDISFVGEPSSEACAALVVCEYPPAPDGTMKILYEDFEMVQLTEPYICGFLAFREVPHLLRLLERLRARSPELMPQLLLTDGNGLLHPRSFGLACQLGVLADLPTIGIGKNLHAVDGLDRDTVHARAQAELKRGGDHFALIGTSGTVWGACLRSTDASSNPIFVSIGHRISLDTATALVHSCCQHRVPTPVRLADLGSRECIRTWKAQQAAAGAAQTSPAGNS